MKATFAILFLAIVVGSCCSAQQAKISISKDRFDSTLRMSGSFLSETEFSHSVVPNEYLYLTIFKVVVDTVDKTIRVDGAVDSISMGMYSPNGTAKSNEMFVELGHARRHFSRDSSIAMGWMSDSLEQANLEENMRRRQNMSSRELIQEAIKANEGIGKVPIPYTSISPILTAHPSASGRFNIEGPLDRDTYLVFAMPGGPVLLYMVGGLLP